MSLFWSIFWIALFIIPAFWLAGIVLQLAFMGLAVIVGGIIELVKYIYEKARNNQTR